MKNARGYRKKQIEKYIKREKERKERAGNKNDRGIFQIRERMDKEKVPNKERKETTWNKNKRGISQIREKMDRRYSRIRKKGENGKDRERCETENGWNKNKTITGNEKIHSEEILKKLGEFVNEEVGMIHLNEEFFI